MSALALPPRPSRLRMVTPLSAHSAASAPSANAPAREASARAAGAPHHPHLRLVTAEPVVEGPGARTDASVRPAAPAELRRRPGAPRPARASSASRNAASASAPRPRAGLTELTGLAPAHPAVRGAQRRAAAGRASQAAPVRRASRPEAARRGATAGAAGRAGLAEHGARAGVLASLPAPMRRGVFSIAVVVLLSLVAAAGIIGSGLMAPVETSTATVQAGQSLWDVAAATGAPDVAEAMAQIVDLNDLDSSTIHPGQTLVVPAR